MTNNIFRWQAIVRRTKSPLAPKVEPVDVLEPLQYEQCFAAIVVIYKIVRLHDTDQNSS